MTRLNGTVRPASQETERLGSAVGDLTAGGREAPRPDPEVVARAKRRRYTAEYKQKVLTEADAARGSGEIGAVLRALSRCLGETVPWPYCAGLAESEDAATLTQEQTPA